MGSVTVDAKWLTSNIDNSGLVILDARGSIPYSYNHIKNARSIGLEEVILTSDLGASLVIGGDEAENLFSSLGIDDSKQVIVYGEPVDPSVGRIVWTLMYHGHGNVRMLEIGFSQWLKLGYPVTRELHASQAIAEDKGKKQSQVSFKSKLNPIIRANAEYIKSKLEDPNVLILDARTAQEHFQAKIPGSILDNWEDGVGSAGEMLKSESELERNFERKGIRRKSEIICFCHAGVRASYKYLQLKQAGYDKVKVYDGSIIDWAKRGYPLR
jgi:thiosulfate/3-mercaptopyruvate sulfurtransferase